MKNKIINIKEIMLGLLTALGLCAVGVLLAGQIAVGEVLHFYETGKLVFIFPFIFAAVCPLVAYCSAKHGKPTYYKSMLIFSIIVPLVLYILGIFFEYLHLGTANNGLSVFLTSASTLCLLSISPITSVVGAMFAQCSDDHSIYVFLTAIPVVVGIISSIILYRKGRVKE